MGFVGTVVRLAAETPPERNRVVDALRAGSILVVVFGHWLMAAITVEGGELVPNHLLELAPQTHPLTWVLQVMPIFFFVGGYSNALSWRSARRRGVGYGGWLRARLRRLALPVIPVLLFWTAFGWLALRMGLDWEVLQLASQVALVPTWFLAAYVVIVTIAPPLLALWDRIGLWSVVAGLALAGLCDLLSIAGGVIALGFLNYVFVWGTVHQLGYAWLDGKLDGYAKRIGLMVVGFLATLALVWAGPFPVAMVGLDTAEVTNSYPPRVTLAFLGLFQVGLVLLLEGPMRRLAGVDAGMADRGRRQSPDHDSLPLASDRHGVGDRRLPGRRRVWPRDRAAVDGLVVDPPDLVCGARSSDHRPDRDLREVRATRPRSPALSPGLAAGVCRVVDMCRAGPAGSHRDRGRGRVERVGPVTAGDRGPTRRGGANAGPGRCHRLISGRSGSVPR